MKWVILFVITVFFLYFVRRIEAVIYYFIHHLRKISLELGDPEDKERESPTELELSTRRELPKRVEIPIEPNIPLEPEVPREPDVPKRRPSQKRVDNDRKRRKK